MICPRCEGDGEFVTCIDDICRGAGECIHGDGQTVCPECHGYGSVLGDGEEFGDEEES